MAVMFLLQNCMEMGSRVNITLWWRTTDLVNSRIAMLTITLEIDSHVSNLSKIMFLKVGTPSVRQTKSINAIT